MSERWPERWDDRRARSVERSPGIVLKAITTMPPRLEPGHGSVGFSAGSWLSLGRIRSCLAWSNTSLGEGWSPEQIAGTMKRLHPHQPEQRVSHETIYNALYVIPKGELRTELLSCLRQRRRVRRPRARGQDRRGQIQDMTPLHVRPPEVEDRLIPGHWEGDLIKGAFNRSAVGTLVERSSRLVLLACLDNASAPAALEGFSRVLNGVPEPMRKTLTYDQGKEMSEHKRLTEMTGVAVFFADPHSPWQRGSNENTNGLLREYLPKGTDLSGYTQDDLNAIAWKLNNRPRKIHGFRTPLQVYNEMLQMAQMSDGVLH